MVSGEPAAIGTKLLLWAGFASRSCLNPTEIDGSVLIQAKSSSPHRPTCNLFGRFDSHELAEHPKSAAKRQCGNEATAIDAGDELQ